MGIQIKSIGIFISMHETKKKKPKQGANKNGDNHNPVLTKWKKYLLKM